MSAKKISRYRCSVCHAIVAEDMMDSHDIRHSNKSDPVPEYTAHVAETASYMTPPASSSRSASVQPVRRDVIDLDHSPPDIFSQQDHHAAYAAVVASNTTAGLVDRAKNKANGPGKASADRYMTIHVHLWMKFESGLVQATADSSEHATVRLNELLQGRDEIEQWIRVMIRPLESYKRLRDLDDYYEIRPNEPYFVGEHGGKTVTIASEVFRTNRPFLVSKILEICQVDTKSPNPNRNKLSLAVIVPTREKDAAVEADPDEERNNEPGPSVQRKRGRPKKVQAEDDDGNSLSVPVNRINKRPSSENLQSDRPSKRTEPVSSKTIVDDDVLSYMRESDQDASEKEEEADEDELNGEIAPKAATPRSRNGRKLIKKEMFSF